MIVAGAAAEAGVPTGHPVASADEAAITNSALGRYKVWTPEARVVADLSVVTW
jgi:hypothetical protein